MANLLTPLSFSGLTARNRIVMPPMWSGQATPKGHVTDTIVEYHRCRAESGCGIVIVEHSFVHPAGRHTPVQLSISDDTAIPGMRRLASAIRAEGAIACVQLAHSGSRGRFAVTGQAPVAPSSVRNPYEPTGDIPEELSLSQIQEIVQAFGAAAVRAQEAGFNAVEIHAAHGYLLSEFLSPLTNLREDGYGGSEDNRLRIHLEVLGEVRRRVGAEFPVFVRLGAHDETPGGLELDAAVRAARKLADSGAALIDVSGGLQGPRGPGREPGYFVPYARSIRANAGVPVMVAGGIVDPLFADAIIRQDDADFVGIGRALLEDPDWPRKAIQSVHAVRLKATHTES